MSEKKELRTERKTLPLTPSEFAAFTAAANAAGMPLTAWLVQAAREKLACENGKMGLTMYGELYQIDR